MRILRLCGSANHCARISTRKTIFDDVKESRIVFCIDTSGSIYKVWDQICSHIVEHLCKMAINNKALYFNVITFDDYVKRFRTKLVIASYINIQELNNWLRSVCFGTSCYIFPALLASYSHVDAECVLLVTDGLLTKEFYEIQQLSAVCNSRPLYLTLLINNMKPNNRVIELASKLLMMTCCSKSRLNVITIAVSGCFVQISPIEWSIRVPSKLYGCPNSCYKFVLDSLHKFSKETTGGICPFKNSPTHNLTSQEAMKDSACQVSNPSSETLLTESSIHLPKINEQQVQRSKLLEMNDCQTQTISGTSEEVTTTDSNQFITSSSHTMYGEGHNHNCMCNSCLACECSEEHAGNKFKRSRYRVARSFINGRSQLDWWADDIRIAPSAGALLLGHTVLAPKYNEGSRLFMGTVLSQVDYCTFIICFEDPNSKIKHRENIQETHVHELLSYLDFHRHPVDAGDFVLVPQCISNCEELNHSQKHYLIPYYVAKVLSGYESRSSIRNVSDKPVIVEFVKQGNSETIPRTNFKIPFNTAIWIPNDLFQKNFLSSKIQWKFTSTEESNISDAQTGTFPNGTNTSTLTNSAEVPNTGMVKSNENILRPFNQLAPFPVGGVISKNNCTNNNTNNDNGKTKMNYAYTKDQLDQLKSEFIDSDYASSMDEGGSSSNHQRKKSCKSESNILSEAFHDFHSDIASRFVERKSCEDEQIRRPINVEACRIYNQTKDVATYIDPELQYGKMYIKWVKDQVRPMNRPEWRYWGAKPIPQLTAPPTFEPFKDTAAWSRSDRLKTTGNILRPEIHFNKSPSNRKSTDHYNSRNVGLWLMDSSLSNKGILKKQYSSCSSLPRLNNNRNVGSNSSSSKDINRNTMDSIRNLMDYDSVCHSLHDNHQLHIAGCDNQTKRADFPARIRPKLNLH
ncbi:unnamed protein product [Schistosoma spindalis]|nr:unnamed protein product [Schistosoma spindale]